MIRPLPPLVGPSGAVFRGRCFVDLVRPLTGTSCGLTVGNCQTFQ